MNARRDLRLPALIVAATAMLVVALVAIWFPGLGVEAPSMKAASVTPPVTAPVTVTPMAAKPETTAATPPSSAPARRKQLRAGESEVHQHFQRAVTMLHSKQYEYAFSALHKVLALAPRMPEAHVNMGFTLIGLERYAGARDFFNTAIELRPRQANSYFGLAVALEGIGDLPGALGAMRSYVHLSTPQDPYVRKARAALWEWEERLKNQTSSNDTTVDDAQPGKATATN